MKLILIPLLRFIFFLIGGFLHYFALFFVLVISFLWNLNLKGFKKIYKDWVYYEEGGELYRHCAQGIADYRNQDEVLYYYKTPYDWLIKRKRYIVFTPRDKK